MFGNLTDVGVVGALVLLIVDRVFTFVRNMIKNRNGGNNPHATTEYVHKAIDKRTQEMKDDIKDLEKKVNKVCLDVGILISRDSDSRDRLTDK